MTFRRPAPALAVLLIAVLVGACAGIPPGWTPPPIPSQLPVLPSGEPGASSEPGASAEPTEPTESSEPSPSEEPSASAEPPASASAEPEPSASAEPSTSPEPSPSTGESNGEYTVVATKPCPDSRFECTTLAVPKDHFAAAGGPTWEVTFAIQRAAKVKQGTFVVITGGPGSSGIAAADGYTDYYATAITDAYDIVFMDQRGIGLSGPIQCIDAAATYYATPSRIQVPAERDAAAAAAQAFVTDCIKEAGIDEADLPLYATTQAIEDLEAVRDHLGADKLQLYGESYGTQFVQQYAAAYPEHVATLFVDGPVDLAVDSITYYTESTRGAEDTLIATLTDCTIDRICRTDVKGRDGLSAYDALADAISAAPVTYDYPKGDGTIESRQLSVAELENAAFYSLYSPADREPFQRAIAAASNGDYVQLAKLGYGAIGVDPETLDAIEDPSWSDALYFAVECQDYAFYPTAGDADARIDAWLKAGQDAGIDDLRLGTSFYGDLPCIYWPSARATDDRPAGLTDVPYPVFVMTSTTDPATPIVNGYRIYSRLDDAYFFQTLGGPHVIYAWGEPCPDDIVTAYLAEGRLPLTRVITCDGQVADDYVPLPPARERLAEDALDLMQSIDDAVLNTDEYLNRLDAEPLAGGCDFGGTVTYTPTDTGATIRLTDCRFIRDYPVTGTGAVVYDDGVVRLRVTSGPDRLRYQRDADGDTSVEGRYQGDQISLEAAA